MRSTEGLRPQALSFVDVEIGFASGGGCVSVRVVMTGLLSGAVVVVWLMKKEQSYVSRACTDEPCGLISAVGKSQK